MRPTDSVVAVVFLFFRGLEVEKECNYAINRPDRLPVHHLAARGLFYKKASQAKCKTKRS